MTLHQLHNDDWGIETNCFVCEPTNAIGLQIPFVHDDEREVVTAEFELTDAHSGAPTLVHGGVTLAVLDEGMAWACIAIGQQWAVTTQTSATFHRAVRVGSRYTVEARVIGHVDATMTATAAVLDRRGELRVEATATFMTLGEATLQRLTGIESVGEHHRYLRD